MELQTVKPRFDDERVHLIHEGVRHTTTIRQLAEHHAMLDAVYSRLKDRIRNVYRNKSKEVRKEFNRARLTTGFVLYATKHLNGGDYMAAGAELSRLLRARPDLTPWEVVAPEYVKALNELYDNLDKIRKHLLHGDNYDLAKIGVIND